MKNKKYSKAKKIVDKHDKKLEIAKNKKKKFHDEFHNHTKEHDRRS